MFQVPETKDVDQFRPGNVHLSIENSLK